MKIILSPSKLQKMQVVGTHPLTKPFHHKLTETLVPKLPIENQPSGNQGHVLASYTGIVFKELGWQTYDSMHWAYAQEHLRILSALYGVLKPLDVMSHYRLDFLTKIPGLKLYAFWYQAMQQYFEREDLIINLASKEYSKLIDPKSFGGKILDVVFLDEQSDGRQKIVTVHAKQARGLMANYMVENLIEAPEHLKEFNEAGYQYDQSQSSPYSYVFVRPYCQE